MLISTCRENKRPIMPFFQKIQSRWKFITTAVLAFSIAWTFYSRVPEKSAQALQMPASPREGFPAPDFSLGLLGGGNVTLSELRGKPVVINVWASWCPPCRAEMPALEKAYRTYKEMGVVVIGVNTTYQDSKTDAAAFVQELGLTFPIALDQDGAMSNNYLITGLPTTFFVDSQGIIRTVIVGGPMSGAVIQTNIEALVKDTP
jgi:cytochrome c biogenesis protein CcmG, thiol:disulfide interchange protein DsbE